MAHRMASRSYFLFPQATSPFDWKFWRLLWVILRPAETNRPIAWVPSLMQFRRCLRMPQQLHNLPRKTRWVVELERLRIAALMSWDPDI